jgi:hypothetical protein
LVSGLALLAGWLHIGDFTVRLANAWFDDSPPVFATWWVDPTRFSGGDPLATYAPTYLYGSAVNWIPALLLRYLQLDPDIVSLIITLAQPTLTALALFLFAFKVTQSRPAVWRSGGLAVVAAWTTALFAIAAQAWTWNLALYTTQLDTPYAGQLALPFAIFAALAGIEQRPYVLAAWLTALTLIHPAIGVTCTLVFTSSLILQNNSNSNSNLNFRSLPKTLVPLIAAAAAAAIAVLLPGEPAGGAIPANELTEALRENRHFNPVISDYLWNVVLPTAIGVAALTILSLRRFSSSLQAKYVGLLKHAAIALLVFVLLQSAALAFGWNRVIQLGAHRFSGVLALLALPAVVHVVLRFSVEASVAVRFGTALMLLLLATHGAGLPWLLIVACFLAAESATASRRRSADLLVLGWTSILLLWGGAAILLADRLGSRALFAVLLPGVYPDAVWLALAIMGAALLTALPQSERNSALIAMIALTLLGRSFEQGRTARQPLHRAVAAAQLWARDNTAQTDVFVIAAPVHWRNLSRRPAIPLAPAPFYLYSRSRAGKEFADSVKAFRARSGDGDWAAFRERFRGDYLVRLADAVQVGEPVYANDEIKIYRLR